MCGLSRLFNNTMLNFIHCIWIIFFNILVFHISGILLSFAVVINLIEINIFWLSCLLLDWLFFQQIMLSVSEIFRWISIYSSPFIIFSCCKPFKILFWNIIYKQILLHFLCISCLQNLNNDISFFRNKSIIILRSDMECKLWITTISINAKSCE